VSLLDTKALFEHGRGDTNNPDITMLSFRNVEQSDYAYATLGIYEQRSVALAVAPFEATYRRSIEKYRAALGAFGAPDPIRAGYREALGEAIRQWLQAARRFRQPSHRSVSSRSTLMRSHASSNRSSRTWRSTIVRATGSRSLPLSAGLPKGAQVLSTPPEIDDKMPGHTL
jgi:hypothetical protein